MSSAPNQSPSVAFKSLPSLPKTDVRPDKPSVLKPQKPVSLPKAISDGQLMQYFPQPRAAQIIKLPFDVAGHRPVVQTHLTHSKCITTDASATSAAKGQRETALHRTYEDFSWRNRPPFLYEEGCRHLKSLGDGCLPHKLHKFSISLYISIRPLTKVSQSRWIGSSPVSWAICYCSNRQPVALKQS